MFGCKENYGKLSLFSLIFFFINHFSIKFLNFISKNMFYSFLFFNFFIISKKKIYKCFENFWGMGDWLELMAYFFFFYHYHVYEELFNFLIFNQLGLGHLIYWVIWMLGLSHLIIKSKFGFLDKGLGY